MQSETDYFSNQARLGGVLREAGAQTPSIERIAFAWVLSAYGRKA
jgi:hypothetical protein